MKLPERVDYLDKGYVEYISHHGSDTTIAMAARASYNADEYTDHERNAKLVKYMIEHKHSSPVEQVNITFRLKMPIFVMRQHVRHRVAKLNEKSLRYVEHDGDFYVPSAERICGQDKHNKQMSGDQLDDWVQEYALDKIHGISEFQFETYQNLLDKGVARELARMVLGTNFYTTVVWQMDLSNLMHYLSLRNDPHAQWEIQQMAQIMQDYAFELFPVSMNAWMEYQKEAVTFSRSEMEILRSMVAEQDLLSGYVIDEVDGSKRRARDFRNKLSQ